MTYSTVCTGTVYRTPVAVINRFFSKIEQQDHVRKYPRMDRSDTIAW